MLGFVVCLVLQLVTLVMFSTWKEKFRNAEAKASMQGWCFEDAANCQAYFSARVQAKIREYDTTELLHEYLVEMADTGFDTSTLVAQVTSPPRAKDWEIGEAFAEVMLEDRFEASFPWPTAWDKRTPKASLPGPDMPGFHGKERPRFFFGEVKSSSEDKTPPQVANSGDDCLSNQIKRLLVSETHRQKLIGWLLVRARDSAGWKTIFDEAMKQYSRGEACICGILVRGGMAPNASDLSPVHDDLKTLAATFDLMLLVFYLPFHKSEWARLIYGMEAAN